MATTKTTTQHKEKSSSASSTPHDTNPLHGRRTPRSSTPDREPPNYLKPTASSRNISDPSRTSKPALPAAGKRVPASKPTSKPPSPSRQPLQTPPPSTIKERSAKSPSPMKRSTITPKPRLDKAPGALRSGRTSPLARARSFESGTSVSKKREARATSPTFTVISTTTAPKVIEEKESSGAEGAPKEEQAKPVEEEPKPADVPPAEDHARDELTELSEPKGSESESDPTPQQEVVEAPPLEPEQEQAVAKKVSAEKEEEEEEPSIESQENLASEALAVSAVEPIEVGAAERLVESPQGEAEEKKESLAVQDLGKVAAVPKKPEVVARKKEAPPAGNAVIEERLVAEKRKNKVLALVGAFETVISLQEPENGGQQQGQKQPTKDEGSNAAKEPTESV